MSKREFVNDMDTKDLLTAIEQYARGRKIVRVQVLYLGEYDGRCFVVEAADGESLSDRRFELAASHWYEVLP